MKFLSQWLSTEGDLGQKWRLFYYHQWDGSATGILWIEARDATKHPTPHKAVSHHHHEELSSLKCQ